MTCSKCKEAGTVFFVIEGPSLLCAACWQAILAALQGVEQLQRRRSDEEKR